jgi:hypothetical protein
LVSPDQYAERTCTLLSNAYSTDPAASACAAALILSKKETDMTNVTVTTHAATEEVAGKDIRQVINLAQRLGHVWPVKSERQNGLWVNIYKLTAA